MEQFSLFDGGGNRKYLTPEERLIFSAAAGGVGKERRAFGLMLYYTGCRISEALNLEVRHIDYVGSCATFATLKQNKPGVYRQVPLPSDYLRSLDDVFDLKLLQRKKGSDKQQRIWDWSRQNGYLAIKEIMHLAELQGIQATPKGLRHGFAIACLDKGIPLNMVQKWMGHAHITTTTIYANALGREERKLAARLWE